MFGLNSVDGSEIMEITPDNFRQKLHRTKLKLKNFLENNCGLINKSATCKCNKRLDFAISNGRISKDRFTFTDENYFVITSYSIHYTKLYDDPGIGDSYPVGVTAQVFNHTFG